MIVNTKNALVYVDSCFIYLPLTDNIKLVFSSLLCIFYLILIGILSYCPLELRQEYEREVT